MLVGRRSSTFLQGTLQDNVLAVCVHYRRMNMDQAAVLAKLAELNIQHEKHAHPAVMTCEAQVSSTGVDVVPMNCAVRPPSRLASHRRPAGRRSCQCGWRGDQESVPQGMASDLASSHRRRCSTSCGRRQARCSAAIGPRLISRALRAGQEGSPLHHHSCSRHYGRSQG